MSDDAQTNPVLWALERSIAALYAEHDGLRVFATYPYTTPDGELRASEFITHVDEDVLTGGAPALLEVFEQELLEKALRLWEEGETFAPTAADIPAPPVVNLARYKTALTVETDFTALAPLREGLVICVLTDDAGNPIAGQPVQLALEGGGRVLNGPQLETDPTGQVAFAYEAAATPGDVMFHVRAARLVVTMEGHVGVPSHIDHDAPEAVEPLSATRITYSIRDEEGLQIGSREISVSLLAGVGQIVDEEHAPDGQGAFTYLATARGAAVFEIRTGAIREHIPVVIG